MTKTFTITPILNHKKSKHLKNLKVHQNETEKPKTTYQAWRRH